MGIEPTSSAWKADILADVLYPQLQKELYHNFPQMSSTNLMVTPSGANAPAPPRGRLMEVPKSLSTPRKAVSLDRLSPAGEGLSRQRQSGERVARRSCDERGIKQKSTAHFCAVLFFLVEITGIEPVTSCMPCKRSPEPRTHAPPRKGARMDDIWR